LEGIGGGLRWSGEWGRGERGIGFLVFAMRDFLGFWVAFFGRFFDVVGSFLVCLFNYCNNLILDSLLGNTNRY
jgi:hypothetical protein